MRRLLIALALAGMTMFTLPSLTLADSTTETMTTTEGRPIGGGRGNCNPRNPNKDCPR